jgi:hypothetical protein
MERTPIGASLLSCFDFPRTKQELANQSQVTFKVNVPRILSPDLIRDSKTYLSVRKDAQSKLLESLLEVCRAKINDNASSAHSTLFDLLARTVSPASLSSCNPAYECRNSVADLSKLGISNWHGFAGYPGYGTEHNYWYVSRPEAWVEKIEDPIHLVCNVKNHSIYFTAICPATLRARGGQETITVNGKVFYSPSTVAYVKGYVRLDSCFCEVEPDSKNTIHLICNSQTLP